MLIYHSRLSTSDSMHKFIEKESSYIYIILMKKEKQLNQIISAVYQQLIKVTQQIRRREIEKFSRLYQKS
ncbi:unnamed protein product [Paramecium octaurelia]|uniref:Uncharacterized protein n=1 Tax=Paramecium octaurelia TaxID=43137 RepID=A0A8S1YSX2_PAROT|nr:unnamed protein product [Paramecium octaurelia]